MVLSQIDATRHLKPRFTIMQYQGKDKEMSVYRNLYRNLCYIEHKDNFILTEKDQVY